MKYTKLNDAWKFWYEKDSFALVWSIPEDAKEIMIPHDAMIEQPANPNSFNGGNTGYRDGDIYTYVKLLDIPKNAKEKTLFLKFEGVYNNALVYVNGQLAGKNMLGYSVFYVALNSFLNYGQVNEIRVQARAGAMTNSRWYSGAGIYRDVYLVEGGDVFVHPDGVQIKTEDADETVGIVVVGTELKNRRMLSARCKVEQQILDDSGLVVAADIAHVTLFENEDRKLSQRIAIVNPKLWDADHPNLYTCLTKVWDGAVLVDESTTTFGIRTLQVDAKRGFRVNGKVVKLRGACIHHDSGLLGAATYDDAQLRQIMKLKEAGFNAVRMAHHPMAPAMLKACDVVGMYVMDEACDMWDRCKSNYDYGLFFNEWWKTDVELMVRKDYNHPSVVMYSVGNEIPEIGTDQGAKTCADMCEHIKSLDNTRYTLASVNGIFAAGDGIPQIVADIAAGDGLADNVNVNNFMAIVDAKLDQVVNHPLVSNRLEMACASTDIAGYNYMTARYEPDGIDYPNRIIVGSETYPPEIARNWDIMEHCNHVIGDFTWTGWDYIGEAGIGIPAYDWGEGGFGAHFPCQLAYCGDIDITGFRRPTSYFREIVFGLRKEPYIAVQNPYKYGEFLIKTPWIMSDAVCGWDYPGCENKPVVVEVYAPGDEVELWVNGEFVGRKASGKTIGYVTLFETTYVPGTVTAVAYENGQEIGRFEVKTAGDKQKISLNTECYVGDEVSNKAVSYEQELYYVTLELQDKEGCRVTGRDEKLAVEVEGAIMLGFGSGNPKPLENFSEPVTTTYNGRAQIILKKCVKDAVVKVISESGLSGSVHL